MRNHQDESRVSFDIRYKAAECFAPSVQIELFENAGFKETHIGFSAYLEYLKSICIIPRIRYIITEFGPNMGFLGIEGRFGVNVE